MPGHTHLRGRKYAPVEDAALEAGVHLKCSNSRERDNQRGQAQVVHQTSGAGAGCVDPEDRRERAKADVSAGRGQRRRDTRLLSLERIGWGWSRALRQ